MEAVKESQKAKKKEEEEPERKKMIYQSRAALIDACFRGQGKG